MDLVYVLANKLGIGPGRAEAVAGALLGAIREQVPRDETAKLDEVVPELAGWQSAAADGGEGFLGTLGERVVENLRARQGGQMDVALEILGRFGLDPGDAAVVAAVVHQFLEQRLGSEWTERIVTGSPMLSALLTVRA